MKTLMIVCGTGVATSTIVMSKVKTWIAENNYQNLIHLSQGKITDILTTVDDYDAVISTTMVPSQLKDKIINGVSLLTGTDPDKVYDEVKAKLGLFGISATYLNPSDAVHGQLGTIKQKDIVIFISKGGNTAELVSFLPNVEEKESKMVLITENQESKIGKVADLVVPVKVLKEADTFNMLATTSTLAVISLFDAVAVVLMANDHFSKNEFLENHPSGDVGDRLREGKD